MVKSLWLIFFFFLIASCASNSDAVHSDATESTEVSALPKPAIVSSTFPQYFSSIESAILVDIQKGTPESVQKAMSALRSNYNNSIEQADVLLAICTYIMDYAWPSKNYTLFEFGSLPTNVYTTTLESIQRGIYENSFGNGDFFSLTIPSLVLFSEVQSTTYYNDALTDLEASLVVDDSSVLTLFLLGVLESRLGNYESSELYLQKALSLNETNKDIVYAYFETLIQSGNTQKAQNFSKQIIATYATDTRVLEFSAIAAFNAGDFTSAESLIAQSLQYAPDNAELLLFRAKVLFELGDYLDVSSLLDAYARTNSQNKDYLLLRSKLQSTWNKNIPSAIKTIQDALTLYPNDFDILLFAANLSSSSAQKIQNKNAIDFLDVVLERDPQNIQALGILVKESMLKHLWQEAYNASTTVLSQENYSLESALQHIEICIALGLLTEARSIVETIYDTSSTNEHVQQWYIRLLIAEGRSEEANTVISNLLPTASGRMKSMVYFERSRLQSSDDRILSDLRTSLTSNPRNEYALFGLYTYYFDRNDYSKAQYYLKQVIALNPSDTVALERNAELETLLR